MPTVVLALRWPALRGRNATERVLRAWTKVRPRVLEATNVLLHWADAGLGWMPLTPFGLFAVVLLSYAVRVNTGPRVDIIVESVGIGGLAICVMDMLTVLVAGIWLWFAAREPSAARPLEVETWTATPTGFRVGLASWAPLLALDVRWRFPRGIDAQLRDSGLGRIELLEPRERSLEEWFVRRMLVRDWFGLARVRFDRRVNRRIRCVPYRGRTFQFELIEQFREGDVLGHPKGTPVGDLVEMRRYVSGDPLKLVLWKTYARTRRLMVRAHEHSVAPTERMLAYLVSAEGDEPAAGVARLALESSALGPEVIFTADGATAPARSPLEGLDQIVRSVSYRRESARGLDQFLTRGEATGTCAAFLFVSPRGGPWLDRVIACVKVHPGPFRAIIGVDGIRKPSRLDRWRRWLMRAPRDGLAERWELRQVRDRLQDAGAQVVIVNRRTGEVTSLEETGDRSCD